MIFIIRTQWSTWNSQVLICYTIALEIERFDENLLAIKKGKDNQLRRDSNLFFLFSLFLIYWKQREKT